MPHPEDVARMSGDANLIGYYENMRKFNALSRGTGSPKTEVSQNSQTLQSSEAKAAEVAIKNWLQQLSAGQQSKPQDQITQPAENKSPQTGEEHMDLKT